MFPGSRKTALNIKTYVVLSVLQYKNRCYLQSTTSDNSQRNIYALGVHNMLINMYQYFYFFIKT